MRKIFLGMVTGIGMAVCIGQAEMAWGAEAPTYGEQFAEKAGTGFTNLLTGWIEIPKNVINVTNESNILWGLTGGVIKGTLHTVARTAAGAFDFITSPIPTKPLVRPAFVWENFTVDTTYGRIEGR